MYAIKYLFVPSTFCLAFSTIILILFIIFFRKSNKNHPPGPKGYPILGNAFLLQAESLPDKIYHLTKQYKRVYRLSLFGQNIIILGNYEVLKEAFINQGNIFSGRPDSVYLFNYLHKLKGIVLSEGKLWQEQQRFTLSTLRNFGMGKRLIEDDIQQETYFMLSYIDNKNGKSFNSNDVFSCAVSNRILKLVANRRIDYSDEILSSLINSIDDLTKCARLDSPVNMLPILRFVYPEFKRYSQAILKIRKFFNDIIDEHILNYNNENINDYIDAYYQRMKEEEENKVEMSNFTREQLIYSIEDIFIAGTGTTTTTLAWLVLFMLHFPNIQEKVQAEIDTVIGRGRLPSWEDKQKMPYTEATILEVQRMVNILPLGFPHKALEGGKIDGYEIPKGTIILADMKSIHYDPMYWTDPMKFEPNRFLDNEGNMKKVVNSFAPFSIGPRSCLGENLAKMELFIIFSSLLQHFNLTSPPGEKPPKLLAQIKSFLSLPLPFKVCATPRKF